MHQVDSSYWSTSLLHWHKHHGRKNLPWKQAPQHLIGYYTLVSECMLQQTQVSRVCEYFVRFIHNFPTLSSLANASVDQVLVQWSGLGYYRRAGFLHETAKRIHMRIQNGEGFPQDPQILASYPGIGKTTAHAIAAQAFQLPYAIVDANVRTIVQRLLGKAHMSDTELWYWATKLTPTKNAGTYCQAIMDFGALVCNRVPNCHMCFSCHMCKAYQSDQVAHIPAKKKIVKKTLRLVAALVSCHQQVWLEQSDINNLWQGLMGPIWAHNLRELQTKLRIRFPHILQYWGRKKMHFTLTHKVVRVHLFVLHVANIDDIAMIKTSNVVTKTPYHATDKQQLLMGNWYSCNSADLPISSATRSMLATMHSIVPSA